MSKRYRRWKKWKQHNLNSKFYQILVLIGFIKSPTFRLVMLDEEIDAFNKGFEEGMKKGSENPVSIFSDYKVGALTDEEFEMECIAFNNRARAEEEREYELSDDDIEWIEVDDE